jgi:hypothetical protein
LRTKTVYSWDADKGEMSQKTETVKSHSEVLKNPLGDFDEHLTLVDEMMQSLDTFLVPSALTSICVVLPVTSALMAPLPPSYNLCATNCAKELTSPLEEGLSVSQPTKAIRPCSVCSILS